MVQGIVEEGRNLEGQNHRGLTGALESRQGQQKVEYQTWDEAAKTASGCMAAGADRNLGTRSRAARQRLQRQAVEARGSGPLSRWTFIPRPS